MLFEPGEDTGEDPRTDPAVLANYRNLRDARSKARAAERAQETPDEDGRIVLGRLPEWDEVHDLAVSILRDHSRDAEIAVWLVEAAARTDGFAGLRDAAIAFAGMVRSHGESLHPQPEDADDDTFSTVAGLNGVGREGTLIQPLRLLSLVHGREYGSYSLWDCGTAGRSDAVSAAMAEAGPAAMAQHLTHAEEARAAFADLDAALTDLRGADAPPFARILDILDDACRTIRRLGQIDTAGAEVSDTATQETTNAPAAPAAAPAQPGRIETREDALRALSDVAAFFRRTEPHSPMSHSLETLIRRGRMDFMSLLAELIPDEMTRENVFTTAGIKRVDDRSDTET
ncbi:type VI secretion system protein TssA [Mesobaculum littorinae]|uniref:type VI secretion system protein TssA n=1 Tax=Mesobaculum littorinae TaxID=2486419 RepID=UPI0013E34310|nr:type VI secretion system protein TssA [Mesobaculum littorinae]